ncbi:hypothetical protein GKC30_09325 [Pseudodesulfovibrio sp. F-1]|uniref:Uncharacterized protein n=1 Tax=Pseudodesulfovibrio alkaliphilus TaxID=2661613 RepID=A0A7K1KP23_9BACT|nr:hypothetical protein [Pseudodesulfovibrio alkaliphilus]MUM77834.1 hypothetical protein [Pseudodesulfovibrio alkaliphilus]
MPTERGTFTRLAKPVLAGIALAYLVTGFFDRPAPVQFQPEGVIVPAQTRIVEPQLELVMEKNIMKLGSPLTVIRDRGAFEENPLARLEARPMPEANATVGSPRVAGDAPLLPEAASE